MPKGIKTIFANNPDFKPIHISTSKTTRGRIYVRKSDYVDWFKKFVASYPEWEIVGVEDYRILDA